METRHTSARLTLLSQPLPALTASRLAKRARRQMREAGRVGSVRVRRKGNGARVVVTLRDYTAEEVPMDS